MPFPARAAFLRLTSHLAHHLLRCPLAPVPTITATKTPPSTIPVLTGSIPTAILSLVLAGMETATALSALSMSSAAAPAAVSRVGTAAQSRRGSSSGGRTAAAAAKQQQQQLPTQLRPADGLWSQAAWSHVHSYRTPAEDGRSWSWSMAPACASSSASPEGAHVCRASGSGAASASAAEAVTETEAAALIDGKAISEQIKREIAEEVARMREATGGQVPGLAVVLVGDRKDSATYVRSKKRACEEAGITSFSVDLPADATEEEVVARVREMNDDPRVHGVLVQLPLPKHISEERVLGAVSLAKDVDGFHPVNIGQLAMAGREPLFVPCTPKGCLELLLRMRVPISGRRAVVIGRSNIVGTPVAMLLQRQNATVTVVHSRTPNPEELVRQADIVVAAAGVANLVRGSWLKPGCVVIDVGINAVDDASSPRGYRLVGDVCFEEAVEVASAITPVPGGVGPMTIAMLLSNTLAAAKRAYQWSG